MVLVRSTFWIYLELPSLTACAIGPSSQEYGYIDCIRLSCGDRCVIISFPIVARVLALTMLRRSAPVRECKIGKQQAARFAVRGSFDRIFIPRELL